MDDDDPTSGAQKKKVGSGEVDYRSKAGTAWSHNFLNQKPWHPLSYPNQRRKWIAEQTDATRLRRQEEVAREFAQEQHFFRQAALFNKKDKDKMEIMKAVSFMYVRPPGYNPESAKAAEIADQNKSDNADASKDKDPKLEGPDPQNKNQKARSKDIYGRSLPTESEFDVLKNAPKLDTGIAGRSKPFAVEIRNVRCVRCGTFGHQSGDRECPLKDTIMPNDETRLKRDDPLNAILAQTDTSEPLKWELKQKPGLSPPRGGFNLDDPNQQILPDQEVEIFDEYGGFLSGGGIHIPIPAHLSNFSAEKPKKKNGHSSSSKRKHKRSKKKKKSIGSESAEFEKKDERSAKSKHKRQYSSSSSSSESSNSDEDDRKGKRRSKGKQHKHRRRRDVSESDSSSSSSSSSEDEVLHRRRDERRKKKERAEAPVKYECRKEEHKFSRKKNKARAADSDVTVDEHHRHRHNHDHHRRHHHHSHQRRRAPP